VDPVTGQVLAEVADLGRAEAVVAVAAADEAFGTWRTWTAADRDRCLLAWHQLMLEDELAALLTAEQGKPLAEALAEVRHAASFLDWFAGEAPRIEGAPPPGTTRESRTLVLRVLASKFGNAGQTCVAANRIYVHENVSQEFAGRPTEATKTLNVGPGTCDGVAVGPLVNGVAVTKVAALVDDAAERGASVLVGGGRHDAGPAFFEPTALAGVTADMEISRTEVFGPVAAVHTFTDQTAVIRAANDTSAALAAHAFTRDPATAWRLAEKLDHGSVGINDTAISTPAAPFGSVKESGLGREASHHSLEEFLEVKHVRIGLGTPGAA
jgi:acyl-CoA reductase-like NAD-dependent aldehyde dehydrogenase